uniref:RXYLT1 C-terminal domain-containing protein n=2 Tax=Compsopogon caeruleus TaxID=31354 RepID=A0A7S1XDT6_9RHOD|mmetsp:Transcript_16551/g.33858  ORF Transcript_16551/g.33858 Transcript_16551/m.33858 type:complete len:430 (+) Transcript_16551:419-1708(+)
MKPSLNTTQEDQRNVRRNWSFPGFLDRSLLSSNSVVRREQSTRISGPSWTVAIAFTALVTFCVFFLGWQQSVTETGGRTSGSTSRSSNVPQLQQGIPLRVQNQKPELPIAQVRVVLDDSAGNPAHPYSLFLAGTAIQYGSGRALYELEHTNTKNRAYFRTDTQPPCVLLTKSLDRGDQWRKAHMPACKLFLVADEYCDGLKLQFNNLIQLRQYEGRPHFAHFNTSTYVPLGPRADFAAAFRGMELTELKRPLDRRYIVNAIYSEDTSQSRKELTRILEKDADFLKLITSSTGSNRALIRIAKVWTQRLGGDHLSSDQYAKVLAESMFTLSPVGHNPESYRIFEAIEAGSIPVIALDQAYLSHACGDPLWRYRETGSPIIFIDRWQDIPRVLRELISNPAALANRQEAVVKWYREFMKRRMRAMEDTLLS